MVNFGNIIDNLIQIGFYDVLLPFILVYAVVFAILEKSGIFSKSDNDKQSKNVNAIIAFVFGLFVVASIQTVRYIQDLIVDIVLVMIFILVTLILLGFVFGKDYFEHLFKDGDGKVKKSIVWTVASIIILVSLGILFNILGVWNDVSNWLNLDFNNDTFNSIVVGVLVIGVLVWITKGTDSKD